MKLAIISHTEHYLDKDGSVVGWGPTVQEINHLAPHFDIVYHVACLHNNTPPPSSLEYTEPNIEFVPIPPFGGNNLSGKLSVLITIPTVISQVSRIINQVDYFQLRLPTGVGNYLLPWLNICKPKAKFWVKYAGNWSQKNPPLGYAFQRWFLTKNFLKCKVTVNGNWPSQPKHVLSFENPCLTEQERIEGEKILQSKNYSGPLDFVFVGQLTEAKGVGRIVEVFKQLKDRPRIGMLHLVGDGPERTRFEFLTREAGIKCKFYGFLPKYKVDKVLAESHVLLLPSESEGFPKVVAEGANYGCIPVVSDISCISQYVSNQANGFLINPMDINQLKRCIEQILVLKSEIIRSITKESFRMGEKFTYANYLSRLKSEIIG